MNFTIVMVLTDKVCNNTLICTYALFINVICGNTIVTFLLPEVTLCTTFYLIEKKAFLAKEDSISYNYVVWHTLCMI